MTDADPTPGTPPADEPDESTDAKEGIRDRSVREVVERTRDVIRKTRELLENSRELLDRVRQRDGDGAGAGSGAEEGAGERGTDEASGEKP